MPGEPGQMDTGGHGALPEGWERSHTAEGIPYYLQSSSGTAQFEHPYLSAALLEMDGMNDIKYAAYRTAMKLRTIQKITHLNVVYINHLEIACIQHGLANPQNTEVLTVCDLNELLTALFNLAKRGRSQFIQPDSCTEVTLSWLLKCLDSGRTALVKARTVKVVLAALCSATLEEKYKYMFQQITSENSPGISKSTLKTLLKDLLLLPLNVSENNSFKMATVDNAVNNCWIINNVAGTDVIDQGEFLYWIQQEPVHVVWLPTLHRLSTAETVKHEAKCSKCKAFPIVGFRYRCLKCTSVDLCQSCYWTQQTLKNHKATHPIREYCLATTTGDDIRDFGKQLKYKLTRKYRNKPPKKTYLDYSMAAQGQTERIPDQSPQFANIHSRVNRLASRLRELEEGADGGTRVVHVEHHEGSGDVETVRQPPDTDQLETKIIGLQEERSALYAEMDRLRERLREAENKLPPPPAFIKVPVPVGKMAATTDVKSQGVNTPIAPSLPSVPSSLPHTFMTGEWSSMYGGEEEKIDELLQEILAAFPTQTSETTPCDLDNQLLRAAQMVGSSLGAMVKEVASVVH